MRKPTLLEDAFPGMVVSVVATLIGIYCGILISERNVTEDCELHGQFDIDDQVYSCELVTDRVD